MEVQVVVNLLEVMAYDIKITIVMINFDPNLTIKETS